MAFVILEVLSHPARLWCGRMIDTSAIAGASLLFTLPRFNRGRAGRRSHAWERTRPDSCEVILWLNK